MPLSLFFFFFFLPLFPLPHGCLAASRVNVEGSLWSRGDAIEKPHRPEQTRPNTAIRVSPQGTAGGAPIRQLPGTPQLPRQVSNSTTFRRRSSRHLSPFLFQKVDSHKPSVPTLCLHQHSQFTAPHASGIIASFRLENGEPLALSQPGLCGLKSVRKATSRL